MRRGAVRNRDRLRNPRNEDRAAAASVCHRGFGKFSRSRRTPFFWAPIERDDKHRRFEVVAVEFCKHTKPANFVCVAQGFDRGGFALFFHARNRDRFPPVLNSKKTLENQCLKLHNTPHFTH